MSDSPIHAYTGAAVDVTWDKRLCVHAAECLRRAPGAFDVNRRPWILPDEAAADAVMEAVRACPSGALVAQRKDGGAPETPPAVNVVRVAADGPLHIRGELTIQGADPSSPGVATRATLCRCGLSANKPFCDNSHHEAGFTDPGTVAPNAAADVGGGGLEVRCSPNGPLLTSGPLCVEDAGGDVRWRGEKAALCRCGHSANKPFCDGSHSKVGFTAR